MGRVLKVLLALPFADWGFEVAMSCTIMEQVDADRMLAGIVRVTRPGQRACLITTMPFHCGVGVKPG